MRFEPSESAAAFETPRPLKHWPNVPTKIVLCTEDRLFPATYLRRVAAHRLGIVPDEIAAGHCVALSRPKDLAAMLGTVLVPFRSIREPL